MYGGGASMTQDKGKRAFKHDVDIEFVVQGDDQAKVLDLLVNVREALGDVKLSKVEVNRYEYIVYEHR